MKRTLSKRSATKSGELKALERAAKQALDIAIRTGTSCHVWQDGKIVDIAAPAKRRAPRRTRKRT